MAKLKEEFDKVDLTYCSMCNEKSDHMISVRMCYITEINNRDEFIRTYRPYCSIECIYQDARLDHDAGDSFCKHFEENQPNKYYCWTTLNPFQIRGSDSTVMIIACGDCVVFNECKYHPTLDTVYTKHTDHFGKCIH